VERGQKWDEKVRAAFRAKQPASEQTRDLANERRRRRASERASGGGASERARAEDFGGGNYGPRSKVRVKMRLRIGEWGLKDTRGVVPRCLSLFRSGHRQQRTVAASKEQGAWLEARCRAVDFETPKSNDGPKRRAFLPHYAVLGQIFPCGVENFTSATRTFLTFFF